MTTFHDGCLWGRAAVADAGKARIRGDLTTGLADRATKSFGGAQLIAADLAVHDEDRAEARVAGRAPRAHLASALGTSAGQLALRFVEVALRESAGEAERDPIAEGLAALFLEPVGRLAH